MDMLRRFTRYPGAYAALFLGPRMNVGFQIFSAFKLELRTRISNSGNELWNIECVDSDISVHAAVVSVVPTPGRERSRIRIGA